MGFTPESLPLEEIPLSGEMGKAQKGCRSCMEKADNSLANWSDKTETLPTNAI